MTLETMLAASQPSSASSSRLLLPLALPYSLPRPYSGLLDRRTRFARDADLNAPPPATSPAVAGPVEDTLLLRRCSTLATLQGSCTYAALTTPAAMSRGLSPRTIALAALCLQSTALGILCAVPSCLLRLSLM